MSTTWQVVAGADSAATSSEIKTVANNIDNVNIVGGISSDVTTVAGIASNVTSVSSISGNVTTVAGIDSNVTTVAGISGEITTVANDGTDIGVVATNISNINTVSGISSNVTTVAGISSDVTSVAADETDIGTVATNIANINTTAGSISNVNTVATNIANVNTVAADETDIGVVAGISSDVTTVSGINANVTTVAGISADVTSVAGDATDIGTVSTNIANVNTTAGSIANINTVASNNTNITTVATDIANVNTTASNITGVNSFAERYRVVSTDPTLNNDEGDLIYNTTSDSLKVYSGSAFATINTTGGLSNIVEDTNPQLGGNLDLNSNDVTGTGNINTTGNLTISGDLTVNGTTTTINSTTISVDDKNIELGATASPTDLTADGGGITLKGSTDHTFNWVNSTDAWTSSEHLNLATGKEYKINNTSLKDVSETLTNKTINSASNTITITESNISDLGAYITASSTNTLTNKSGNISQWTNDSAYLTGNQTITLSGDASGSGTTAITVTVADDSHNHIISNVDGLQTALDAKLANVVEDTTPQLGGNLDLNSNDITGTGNVNITGTIQSSGNITGTLATAAQPNITSVGTLTSLTVSGDATFDTDTIKVDSTNNRVGIGQSSPLKQFEVNNSGDCEILIKAGNTSTSQLLFGDTNDLDIGKVAYVHSDNSMRFHTADAERFRMEADGDFHADGDVIAYSTTVSDVALKSDIEMIPNALDKIDEVRGVTFTRHNGQKSAGIIAQELEKVLPEAVREKTLALVDGKKYKTVEYDAIHGLLINCIKELKEEIKELKNAFSK